VARGPRWQPFVVAAGLLAPPLGLAVAVWPASASGGDGGDADTELAVGDDADGTVGPGGVTVYELTVAEDGAVRIDVLGRGGDPTLTVRDDDGRELGFNDDTDGLDSSVEVDVDAGQVLHAEVRSFSGEAMAFTIRVRSAGAGDGGGDGGGGGDDGREGDDEPSAGPDTTIPGDVEAFGAPLGDEPIEIDGPGGLRITLREDGGGGVCLESQRPNGGSGTCGGTLADLRGTGGFGGSFDGRVSTIDVLTMVGPEVAAAVAVDPTGDETTLDLLAIPGRVEQFVVGQLRFAGDAFSRPGGSGVVIELRDADGDVVESFPA
jgi:hypothetical protein